MAHDIFLSYSRQDSDLMVRLSRDLRAAGFTVWTDEGIEPGAPSWKMEIERAIRDAALLVVLLSPDAAGSKWVRAEIDYAETLEKPLYPVLVRGDKKTSVPFGMSAHQFIDFRQPNNYADALQKLADALTKSLETAPRTVVPQATPPSTTTAGNLNRRAIWIAFVAAILIVMGSGVAFWAYSQQGTPALETGLDGDTYTLEVDNMAITLPLTWAGDDGVASFNQFITDNVPDQAQADMVRQSLLIDGQWGATGNLGLLNMVAMGRLDMPITLNPQMVEGFVLRLWENVDGEITDFQPFAHPIGEGVRAIGIGEEVDGLVAGYYIVDPENRDLYWVLFLTPNFESPDDLFALTDQLIQGFVLTDTSLSS